MHNDLCILYILRTAGLTDEVGIAADVASLSVRPLHALAQKGGVYLAVSPSKGKVGLQGKGEREGAMPLAAPNLGKAPGFDLNAGIKNTGSGPL